MHFESDPVLFGGFDRGAVSQREWAPKSTVFGSDLVFEAKCKSVGKCHSVQRLIECMHIWNGNGDEERINELLSENGHFSADYDHILKWHLDSRNEFQTHSAGDQSVRRQ